MLPNFTQVTSLGLGWVDPRDENAGWDPVDLLVPRQKTLPTRALVWGIVGVLIPISLAPAAMGIMFGTRALRRAKRLEASGGAALGRRRGVAGIVLGIASHVVLAVSLAFFVLVVQPS